MTLDLEELVKKKASSPLKSSTYGPQPSDFYERRVLTLL